MQTCIVFYDPLICHQFMTKCFSIVHYYYSCISISQGKKHLLNEWEEHNNVQVAVKAYELVRYVMTHLLWAYRIYLIYDNSLPSVWCQCLMHWLVMCRGNAGETKEKSWILFYQDFSKCAFFYTHHSVLVKALVRNWCFTPNVYQIA